MNKHYTVLRLSGLLLGGILSAGAVVGQSLPAARVLASDGTPQFIRLGARTAARGTKPADTDMQQVLHRELALGPDDELRPLRTETDALGFVHTRLQQYYQGVKVEHGTFSVHGRGGRLETLSGELKRPTGLRMQPTLSAATARQRALKAVGATRYMWQEPAEERALREQTGKATASYFPQGELVVVGDFRRPAATRPLRLAWKFDVYAQQPLSRANVYVDAQTGQVVLSDAIIKHTNAPGTFATRYSGSKASTTDYTGTTYRLRETSRGNGIETYNSKKGSSYAASVDFTDLDNNWSTAEFDNATFDNAALDAHYGAQSVYDYWSTQHSRNSYDNAGAKIRSYVHYDDTPSDGVGYENAFWNGAVMTYGDGASAFKPLTALDVCGHEIGHAVCSSTANLIYENESGALNEGFSDIWGACVEYYKDPTKQTWLIGEDIIAVAGKTSLRSMSDPGSSANLSPCPAYYKGQRWVNTTTAPSSSNDNGGVHTNSGVLNYWFYLLSVGKTGVNEAGKAFSVTGITIDKAAKIAYRAESIYLTPSSDYKAARTATLLAAADLYGQASPEMAAVASAWFAVGLGEAAPTLTSFAQRSGPVGSQVTLTGTNFLTAYSVAFNGQAASFVVNSATSITAVVPAGATDGPLTVTTPSGTATSADNFTVTLGPVITGINPAGAVNGESIVISGTYFEGATAVTFTDNISVPAALFVLNTSVSPQTITLIVPPGAVSGSVTVTAGSTSAPYYFEVIPFAIAGVSPARNATTADRLTPVALTFSQVPDAATAAGASTGVFSSRHGGRRNARGAFSSTGTTVTYTPGADEAFRAGEVVTVTTTAGATSNSGGALPGGHTYQFTTAAGAASGALGAPSYPAVGRAPFYVAVGDVNNDGLADVVATNTGSGTGNTATVLLGNGLGGFGVGGGTNVATLTVGTNPRGVVLADINNDGRLDILVANFTSASVSVWVRNATGNGAGDFTAAPTLPIETGPIGLATGDFNNDGWLDVVTTTNYGGNAVLDVYMNTKSTTGTFDEGTSLGLNGDFAYGVATADFNSDGWLDLAAANANGNSVTVALNNKAGQFTSAGTTYAVGTKPRSLAVGDVNKDGHLDLVTANAGSGTASVLLGSAAGTFTAAPAVSLLANNTNYSPENVSLADINGDGKLDLLATLYLVNPGKLLTRMGNGDGTFATPAVTDRSIGTQSYGLAVADIDNNGSLDVVTANAGTSTGTNALSVLLNPAILKVVSITPASGMRGSTSVTVTGSGFTAGTTVSIGGVALTSAQVNTAAWPQTITGIVAAATPLGAQPVVAATGTNKSNTDVLFTVMQQAPAITDFTPKRGTEGTLVTVTGTNLDGATAVTINGVAQTVINNTAGSLQISVAVGTTTGLLRVTTPGGTATSATSFTLTPDLVVNSAQTISGNYNNLTISSLGVVTLNGDVTVDGALLIESGGTLNTNCQQLTGPGSFTLAAGATLGICDAAGISATGLTGAVQLTGGRSFSPDASYLYNGTAAQVTGTGLPSGVRSLTTTNASNVTLTAPVSVTQLVTIGGAGNLVLNNHALMLLSDAAGTALVVNSGTGVVSGNTAVMQRHIETNTANSGYRHYSSPMQSEKVNTLATVGYAPTFAGAAAYNQSATPGSVTPFPTIFRYSQDAIAVSKAAGYSNFDKGWQAVLDGEQMKPGQGFTVQAPGTALVDFTGTFTSGSVDLTGLSRGAAAGMGWHLLGNPYPAPLDWSTLEPGTNLENLNAAVYVVQSSGPYTGTYRTYLAASPADAANSPIIPAGQGFFVRTTTPGVAGALHLTNGNRVTTFGEQPKFGRGNDQRPVVRLQLSNATSTDVLTVYADPAATDGLDASHDAVKLSNPSGLNLWAVAASSDALAIDGLAAFTAGSVVPLRLSVATAGSYTLRAAAVANLPAGLVAYLSDATTGQQLSLSAQSATTLQLAAGQTTRYSLVFARSGALAAAAALPAAQVTLHPNPAGKAATVLVGLPVPVGTRQAQATVFNALGQVVSSAALTVQSGHASGSLSTLGLAAGVYVVRLEAGSLLVSKRLVVE
jgi:Zn-dependent metalloprotease